VKAVRDFIAQTGVAGGMGLGEKKNLPGHLGPPRKRNAGQAFSIKGGLVGKWFVAGLLTVKRINKYLNQKK